MDGFMFPLRHPGESQTLSLDREWIIKFDNGLRRQVNYRLQEGRYKFTVDPQSGWDLARVEEERPSSPVMTEGPPSSFAGNSILGK